tara:strand:- start:616 stop:786 length:171 start_codon:yes stop_codon:yes gene_type:complete
MVGNKKIKKEVVICQGSGEEGAGHPRIYLRFGDSNEITCPYCGRKFNSQESEKQQD